MAVTLGITINESSYDEETNTSLVTVCVVANFTTGSYNATGNASGTLYINDVPYTFRATFNSDQAESGSEVIYLTTVAVDLSVTNVVNCRATFNTGVSSGTISASNSLTLSGSPPGGDDDEEGTMYYYQVNHTIGDGVMVDLDYDIGGLTFRPSGLLTGNGVVKWGSSQSTYGIYVKLLQPENYDLVFKCTRNRDGRVYDVKAITNPKYPNVFYVRISGKSYHYAANHEVYTIIVKARPKAMVHIDNGTEITQYLSCIEDGNEWHYYTPYIDNGSGWDMYC